MFRLCLRWCALCLSAACILSTPAAVAHDPAIRSTASSDNAGPPCGQTDPAGESPSTPPGPTVHYQQGLEFLRQGKLEAAAIQLRTALQYKPDLLPARNALGSALLDLGCNGEAENEFRKVLQRDPDSFAGLDGLAQVLAADRRYTAAIAYWKKAISLRPDSPDLTRAMGIALYSDGKPEEAIEVLTSITKAHPGIKSAHFALAGVYAHQKRYREAAAEYGSVLQLDANDNQALLARVRALIDGLAYQDALQAALEYRKRDPGDALGRLLLGSVYVELGDYGKGEEELDRSVAAMPQNATAQYELGIALARDHKPAEALPHLEQALALDPQDALTQYQLARVLRELGDQDRSAKLLLQYQRTKEQDSSPLTNQANASLSAGEAAKAAEIYRQILSANPQDARTEYNLALAMGALQDREGEKDALEKAVRLDPHLAAPRFELGTLALNDGDMKSAERWLEAAITADPQLAAAKKNLSFVYARLGEGTKAEKMLRDVVEDAPEDPQSHLDLGALLAQRNEFAASEVELNRAVQLAPGNAQLLSTAGKVKEKMGERKAATSLLQRVVLLEPESVDAHLDLSVALAEGYDLPGALEEANRAVHLSPSSAIARFHRGRILFYLRQDQEARLDLETACRLAPRMGEAYFYLALVERQLGNYPPAIASLAEVLTLQPNNGMAWNLMGDALEHDSRHEQAVATWRHAITLDPHDIRSLGSLAAALRPVNPAQADRLDAQISAQEKEAGITSEAQGLHSQASAFMRADDWPDAIQYLQNAIQICRHCAVEAELHKSLGLIHCDLGELDQGEAELGIARHLRPGDPQVDRALAQIVQARADHSSGSTSTR